MWDDDGDKKLPNIPVWPTDVKFTVERNEDYDAQRREDYFEPRHQVDYDPGDSSSSYPSEGRERSYRPSRSTHSSGGGSGKVLAFLLLLALGGYYLVTQANGPRPRRPSDDVGFPAHAVATPDPTATTAVTNVFSNLAEEGSNPSQPTLAPDDDGFQDTRGGWGWSDRCWKNLHAGKFGWAEAECQQGIAVADSDKPQPRSSLLYNLGLIDEKTGSLASARSRYELSLALRENAEVREALNRVNQ